MGYGDIVLATSKSNWLSKCIRWFTNSKFSHSLVTTPSILNTPMCMEAAAGGIDMSRFDWNYLDNTDEGLEIWTINVSQAVKDAAIQQMLNDLEISYGYLEYPWFIYRKFNLLFGRDIKSQNNWNTDGMICSQLVVAYLKACGLQSIFNGYGNGSVAPQDLRVIFVANPNLFTLSQSVRM